ncbi:autotransporter outer membrane beta-barrel domain-containing protein [Candidatus Woesearchaeota archaeon]|nr:autotransporter outer membrane beta-barrel domain-containing protein [Candidatus Woesearchaeota archaeon]
MVNGVKASKKSLDILDNNKKADISEETLETGVIKEYKKPKSTARVWAEGTAMAVVMGGALLIGNADKANAQGWSPGDEVADTDTESMSDAIRRMLEKGGVLDNEELGEIVFGRSGPGVKYVGTLSLAELVSKFGRNLGEVKRQFPNLSDKDFFVTRLYTTKELQQNPNWRLSTISSSKTMAQILNENIDPKYLTNAEAVKELVRLTVKTNYNVDLDMDHIKIKYSPGKQFIEDILYTKLSKKAKKYPTYRKCRREHLDAKGNPISSFFPKLIWLKAETKKKYMKKRENYFEEFADHIDIHGGKVVFIPYDWVKPEIRDTLGKIDDIVAEYNREKAKLDIHLAELDNDGKETGTILEPAGKEFLVEPGKTYVVKASEGAKVDVRSLPGKNDAGKPFDPKDGDRIGVDYNGQDFDFFITELKAKKPKKKKLEAVSVLFEKEMFEPEKKKKPEGIVAEKPKPGKDELMEDLKQRQNPDYVEGSVGGIFVRENTSYPGDANHKLDMNRAVDALDLSLDSGFRLKDIYTKLSLDLVPSKNGTVSGSLVTPAGEVDLDGGFDYWKLGGKAAIDYLVNLIEERADKKVRRFDLVVGLGYDVAHEAIDGRVNGESISNSATQHKAYANFGVQDGHLSPEGTLRAVLWGLVAQLGYNHSDEENSPDRDGIFTGLEGNLRFDLGDDHSLILSGSFNYSWLNSMENSNDIESNPLNLDAGLAWYYTLLKTVSGQLRMGVKGGYGLLHDQTSVEGQPLVETTQHGPYIDFRLRFEFGDTRR